MEHAQAQTHAQAPAQAPTVDFNKQPDGAQIASGVDREMENMAFQHAAQEFGSDPDNYSRSEQKGDEGIMVEFYRHPVDGLDHIKLVFPGDKLHIPDDIVEQHHKNRFWRQWQAYEAQEDQLGGQTRLRDVTWLDVPMRQHLADWRVLTVEHLANLPDTNLDNLGPGGRALRDKAIAHMKEKEAVSHNADLLEEIRLMREKITKLEADAAPKDYKYSRSGPSKPAKEAA